MFAEVIIDISHENVDRVFEYEIPEEMNGAARVGAVVVVPFGRGDTKRSGCIVGLEEKPKYDPAKIKRILSVQEGITIESRLIALAAWMRTRYGGTMSDALKTVLPVKKEVREKTARTVTLAQDREAAAETLRELEARHYTAKARVLTVLLAQPSCSRDYTALLHETKVSAAVLQGMEAGGLLQVSSTRVLRNPVPVMELAPYTITLNEEQQKIADDIIRSYDAGERRPCLIHGVTGSGKTEIYMELIHAVISRGKKAVFLIPEIALTYQMVRRFYQRFGDRISILNSRMSAGERYDQYQRAREGTIDVMIGPRSALFTPFSQIGLIVMDEEQEGSYKSENPPRYHTRETAQKLAELSDALFVMGSATPSVEAYYAALSGRYRLYTLAERAGAGTFPKIWVEDLREELKAKNRSIFSRRLHALIDDRLAKQEQIMLFINRRGMAGFVSCRSCGYVLKCPHCDISMTSHRNGMLVCHYCGYTIPMPKTCPDCGSPYISAFGTGTQKVEMLTEKEWPGARILRMDLDTTSGKDGHAKILAAWANHEADILIGTQMIVKGHDFPNVTLVGILAADLSLFAGDYHAGERTFELLAQAAGRAGRGEKPGEVVIQTYHPDHYAVLAAQAHDYRRFYEEEITYRKSMGYPPAGSLLVILVTSEDEEAAAQTAKEAAALLQAKGASGEAGLRYTAGAGKKPQPALPLSGVSLIGPASPEIAKIADIYRQVMYLKCADYGKLIEAKDLTEGLGGHAKSPVRITFDFNPVNLI